MTLNEFHDRFNFCQDSILQRFELSYDDNSQKSAQFTVCARDWQSLQDDWRTIILTVSDIKVFKFTEEFHQTHHVISHGIHLTTIDGKIICEFGDLVDMPIAFTDLQFSNAFVIGKDFQISL